MYTQNTHNNIDKSVGLSITDSFIREKRAYKDEFDMDELLERPELSKRFQSRKAALNERLKDKHPEIYQAICTLVEIEKRFSDTPKK